MQIIKVESYATLNLATFSTGDEIGARIPLIRGHGHATDALIHVACTTVAGGTGHSIEPFLAWGDAGGRLEPLNIAEPAEVTTVAVSYTLPTNENRILSLYRHKLEAAAPIFGPFLSFTVTHDRTSGTVVVSYALYRRK